jgi:hypothetical protein
LYRVAARSARVAAGYRGRVSSRGVLFLLLGLAILAGAGVTAWRLRAAAPPAPADSPLPRAARGAPPSASRSAAPPASDAPAPPPAAEAEPEQLGLGGVDLDAVREALPDNLYWETSAPTDDPGVLEERERAKALRNELYGKILSGTGTDEEILEYYDYRMRASSDYVAFVDYLLEHHGSDLTDQDLGLLLLAKRLHLARLEEIPRKIQEARERKAEQDEARRAWREEQEAFEAQPVP